MKKNTINDFSELSTNISSDLAKGFKSSVSIYLAKAIVMTTGAFLSIVLVRHLSPSDYGTYALIQNVLTFGAGLTALGLVPIAIRYIPEYAARGLYSLINKLFCGLLGIRLLSIGVIGALFYCLKDSLFNALNFPTAFNEYTIFILMIFTAQGLTSIVGACYITAYIEEYKISIISSILAILTLVSYWYVLNTGLGILGILTCWVILSVIPFLYYISEATTKIYQNIQKDIRRKLDNKEIKRISRYGFFMFSSGTMGYLRDLMIDNFVIVYYLGPKMVGLYTLAATLVLFVNKINPSTVLKNVLYPIVVKKYTGETGKVETLKIASDLVTKLSLFVVTPAFLGLVLLGRHIIIFVYSPKYISAFSPLVILSFFFFFSSLNRRFGIIAQAVEKSELFMGANLLGIYNIIMNIVLVKRYGINGIAFASGSTALLTYIFFWVAMRYYVRIIVPYLFKATLRVIINCLPMMLFIVLIRKNIWNLWLLISVIVFSILLYCLMSILNKVFSIEERELINKAVGKTIWVF